MSDDTRSLYGFQVKVNMLKRGVGIVNLSVVKSRVILGKEASYNTSYDSRRIENLMFPEVKSITSDRVNTLVH